MGVPVPKVWLKYISNTKRCKVQLLVGGTMSSWSTPAASIVPEEMRFACAVQPPPSLQLFLDSWVLGLWALNECIWFLLEHNFGQSLITGIPHGTIIERISDNYQLVVSLARAPFEKAMNPVKLLPILAFIAQIPVPSQEYANDFVVWLHYWLCDFFWRNSTMPLWPLPMKS